MFKTPTDYRAVEAASTKVDKCKTSLRMSCQTALDTILDAQTSAHDQIYAHQQSINLLHAQVEAGAARAKQLQDLLTLMDLQDGAQQA